MATIKLPPDFTLEYKCLANFLVNGVIYEEGSVHEFTAETVEKLISPDNITLTDKGLIKQADYIKTLPEVIKETEEAAAAEALGEPLVGKKPK